ncbi:MAG: SDR family NAD(P)-dependent oxidoreductase, partial [Ruminiclostridium sp.]|nr:SDR family NAD(P)-dependent oxidoreductase [Ruminiclostridium sp.]
MGKTAVITGSSRGIGKACALKLAEKGFDIVVNYNSNEEAANKTVEEITALGRKAIAVKADASDIKQVQDMFRTAVKEFGGIDVLVNNAGVVNDAYLLMLNGDSLQKSLDINIKGYFNCAQQAALKMMKNRKGSIINISSVSGTHALVGQSVYSATKGAVNSMTMVLAKELA